MSLGDDGLRIAVLKTLADDVAAVLTGDKDDLKAVMSDQGIKALSAKLPDGTPVATLTLAGGQSSPRVTDPGKFLAWVKQAHPTETEVIVRPDYQKTLLDGMKQAGKPVDPRTGEIVPGVEFEDTTPYLTPSFSKGDVPGREHIRRAWRDGVIALPDLLALPAGENGDGS